MTVENTMTESNELYAVKFGDVWSIAEKVKASEYGLEPAEQDVWSEQGTTALVGIVGKEDAALALRTPSDGEVVAAENVQALVELWRDMDKSHKVPDKFLERLSEVIDRINSDEAHRWRENVEAMLSTGDPDVVRCREGGGPEDLIGSLVLTMMRTRNARDKALFSAVNGETNA